MKTQNLKLVSYLSATFPAVLLLFMLTGCATNNWNLQFSARTPAAVRFDVVGINSMDKKDWETVPVDDYWTNKNNSMRSNAERLTFEVVGGTIKFVDTTITGAEKGLTGSGTKTVVVPQTSPLWEKWKARNVVGLVVIGDFPGTPTAPDKRKQIVPLYTDVWEAEKHTLQFEIQDGRVQVVTAPSPKAQKYLTKRGW